ncbi:hypothetical protein NDU88_010357 [Pleurodeles waltl]|uniref:Uncharacterized protein n=1 Tax=Pleurodeles waltl TaxID=8319 RepID=A0AAV7PUN7_PLEWA|nr:hypothetical protein NDU88_010357 [Pleurodeles waltl]
MPLYLRDDPHLGGIAFLNAKVEVDVRRCSPQEGGVSGLSVEHVSCYVDVHIGPGWRHERSLVEETERIQGVLGDGHPVPVHLQEE